MKFSQVFLVSALVAAATVNAAPLPGSPSHRPPFQPAQAPPAATAPATHSVAPPQHHGHVGGGIGGPLGWLAQICKTFVKAGEGALGLHSGPASTLMKMTGFW